MGELYRPTGRCDTGSTDIFGINRAMNITVLTLEGVFDTGLATILDAFSTANELAAMQSGSSPPFNVSIAGVRAEVTSSHRFKVP